MPETRRCPGCGANIPPDAAEGVCPKCLIKLGLQDGESSPAGPDQTAPVSPRFSAPEPEELAKRFPQLEILELLGQGGMGAVYKARQPALDRLVAVKILPPEVAEEPDFTERFTREARALARLNHPNIVSVHDFGQVDGQFYFVMEFVDGLNLRQTLKKGTLKPQEALAIVPQICEALQFAHDEGLVHRDIKPENILLDRKGRVKIADFGLAKLLGKTPAEITLTRPGHVMGTPQYMAPEQMEHPLEVDHRADIYSLGVVFYEMLTGELPMGRFDPPSKKVEIDVRLDQVVLKTLEKEPARRYQRVSEVKTELDTISNGRASGPALAEVRGKISPRDRSPGEFGPRFLLIAISLVLSLLMIAAGGVFIVIGFLKEGFLTERWWGYMGGAFGCLCGGGGGLFGTINYYRKVRQPDGPEQKSTSIWVDKLWLLETCGGLAILLTGVFLWSHLDAMLRFFFVSLGAVPILLGGSSLLWREGERRSMLQEGLANGVDLRLMSLAVQMVICSLAIAAGVFLLAAGALSQFAGAGGDGWAWGYMGGALGFIGGGGGALVGAWNTYRGLEGSGNLLEDPGWNWLDGLIAAYTLLGLLSSVFAFILSHWLGKTATYCILLLGGIVVFQGVLFLIIRGLLRRAARQESVSEVGTGADE
ncbi:MAG: serine/threonine-protein kinase [Planctomycetota bacterium]|nr:serine/threonine-protein kinase [Planctomycetota bacterium]